MKQWLISGNDTGVGKTWFTRQLAHALAAQGARVQVVKPIETGVTANTLGDAQWATEGCPENVTAHRGFAFAQPIAPLAAASLEGITLTLSMVIDYIDSLPPCDCRLIEGAGGLAVPLDDAGRDWADLANALSVDRVILVVENRLGAIHQARLLEHYAHAKGLPAAFFFNQRIPNLAPELIEANTAAFARLTLPHFDPSSENNVL